MLGWAIRWRRLLEERHLWEGEEASWSSGLASPLAVQGAGSGRQKRGAVFPRAATSSPATFVICLSCGGRVDSKA